MRKTKKQRFRASILAFLLIASMVLGMAPGSAGQVYAKESTSQTSSEEEPGFIDKAVGLFKDTGEKIASFFGAGDEAQPAAAYDTKKEADPDTLQTWQPLEKDTTENIGRIWTDKTVSTKDMEFEGTTHKGEIGDSQFLVALSALSSTSNTVTTSSKPLDIVLVLDVSGSMGDPLQYNYTATYNVSKYGKTSYYAQNDDGTYTKIEKETGWSDRFDHWEFNGKVVTPKESASDTTAGRIQFYTRSSAGSKMNALKTAANNFLTETAKQNDIISDPNKQHEISVVKFAGTSSTSYGNDTYRDDEYTYNYSQRLKPLTAYNSQTISSLTDMIDSIKEGGATSADYGMQLAQSELDENGRQDAQKVIIFFTDGEPNHSSGFNRDVANNAISASKALKDKKAIVYSIGVFADANPDNTSTSQSNQFNAYMHGISSNYPAATAWNTLGTEAEELKYYKAASDADQLNQIFEDILQDVNTGSGFPTEITQGDEPNEGGYVTFDDQLGAYMQVDAFKSILFANKKFDLDPDTGVETVGNVTTYTFEGEGGNDLYPKGNLHDIIITVTKSDNLAVGDQVKVKIPASMIPLRHFSVDTNANGETTMKVKETWPIRLLYGASMKPGVAETLQDGLDDSPVDQALETYLEANQTNIDGKAAAFFYSNLYTGKSWAGHDGKTLGDTIASFDPAKGNTFYYFTEDTPIYTDEGFTQPVEGQPVSGDTYYYKKVFWSLEEGQPAEKTVASPFASDNFEQASANWGVNEQGEVYIKAGSAKLTGVDSLTLSKERNTTNTATEVINPQWNVNNPNTLSVYLGNNGRVAMEVPGELEITKKATVAADKNLNKEEIVKDKKFTFNISIPKMADKTVKAEKRNLQGDIQGDAFDLRFDGQGKAEAALKDNETLYIHGLDAGVTYTVTEDADSMAQGFALTSVDGEKKTKATGTIEAGVPKSHTFTNTYDVKSITVDTDANANVKLTKQLTGRNWKATDQFNFTIAAKSPENAPMPMKDGEQKTEASVTQPEGKTEDTVVGFGFGTITFDQPGTYLYEVTEENAGQTLNGITYDETPASIQITVQDPGDGQLTAKVTAYNADFVNTYTARLAHNAAGGIVTTKTLHGHDMADRQFAFQVEALDGTGTTAAGNAKRIGINDGTTGIYRNDSAAKDGEKITMKTADGNDIKFTTKDIGKTFKYKFSEVKGNQAGYTYDKAVYTVELWVTDDGDGTLTLHTKVTDKDGKETTTESNETPEGKKETVLDFTNSYAASGSLDGSANLAVTKNLEGRSWNPQDKFFFRLEATGLTASQVGEGGSVQLPDNAKNIEINANSANHKASFGDITFTKPGRYTFAVSESIPGLAVNAEGIVYKDATEEQKAQGGFVLNGITYDGSTKNITVNVVEEDTENGNGKLVATIAQNSDSLTFTNTYNVSSITLNTDQQFNVTKTLVGRDWTDTDAFKFTLTAVNNAPMPVEDEVTAIKDATTQTFGVITYDKAGTYEYQIKEILPQDKEEGLTYDTHTAAVKVKVTENFVTGTLSVESVTYSDGADGAQFTNVLGDNTKEVTSDDTDVDHGMVGVGDELTYTINWVNDGVDENGKPAEATVTITDKIPAGTEFVSTENGGVYEDGTVTWTINAKAAETGSVSFKVKVTEVAGGTAVENKGEIKVGNNEPKVTNKVQTIVPGKKETSKPEKIEEGTILNYEISFVNADGAGAGATVVDKMTTGLEYQVSTATVGGSKIEPTVEGNAASGQTLTWNLTDLADNAKVTITFNVKVTRDALDSVDNSATVNGHKSNVVTTPYPSDDKKTVEDKDGNDQNNGMVGVGDELTYVIDWAADEAGKVTITDIVPTGTEFVSAENGGVHENGTVTWVIKDAKKGQKGSVSFTVKVTGEAGGKDVLNKANVKVGDNNPKVTNEVKTFIPGKDSALAEGDTELQVGDVLTYTISYKNPEDTAATVTITDKLPEGLTFVEASNDGVYANGTLTWTLTNVPAGGAGIVTFKASVNENAKKEIENKATIQVGENSPKYSTDTDGKTLVEDGNLAISKTIAMTEGQGTKIDTEKEFTFTVTLKDTAGKDLTKQYAYTIKNGDKEVSTGNVEHNGTLKLKHGETATITGLPSGAQYTVTETPEAGYTSDKENNTVTGTIPTKETATADFTNTYSVTGSLIGSDALTVTKELVGREWLDTDIFAYQLTAADEPTKKAVKGKFITLPDNAGSLEITKEFAEHQAAFGDIQFTIAGTFKFNVTEQPSDIVGITDDKNAERTVVVKVTDKKDGTLEAVVVKGESDDLTFTNTYGAGTGEDDIAAKIPATKKLTGRDMKAEEFQFEVVTRKANEKVENFKEEVVATGTNKAAKADAAGTVIFAGKDDVKLTYTVESLNQAVEAGYAVKEVKEGQSVWTVSYTARELTDKLPGGVKAVEGKISYDFIIVVTDNNNGTLTAQVQAPDGGIAFENAYTTGGTEVDTDPTDATAYFNKVLTGRDWSESDEFTFTIAPQDGAPAPEGAVGDGTKTVSVTSNSAKAGESVPFGFGKIPFTDADMAGATTNEDGTLSKTFTYQITENDVNEEAMPGVTIDTRVAKLKITVTDNLQGELSVATAAITVENGTFTNMYESSLDYTAVGGLQITKVLNGRDMEAGQFTFTVTPEDKDSADKLGLAEGATEFTNTAKAAGEVDTMDVLAGKNVTFTQADAGKTFTYTVAEKAGDNSAYSYDIAVRTVTIKVVDNTDSTLTVTTRVMKDGQVVDEQIVKTADEGQKKATVAFVNTYNDNPTTLGGEGNVKINATKSLTNRPMVDGEFTFHVLDKNQNPVTSGTNSADGTITFDPVTYDTDKLIADEKAGIAKKSVQEGAYVYTYDYKVVEAPTTDGVTGDATTFAIQVIVTDKGDGTLELKVQYPEGTDSLAFKNLYGEGAEAEITINGHKQYEVASGDNEPDITGKYTFTITGSEGAPMPKQTKVTNDYAGNVDFGAITYTMENVFGDTGSKAEVAEAAEGAAEDEAEDEVEGTAEAKSAKREKTFTYTVAESGSVPGVQNDGSSKTFTVKVTDNGNGKIAVEKSWKENEFPFSFTNTYSVDPVDYSINTDLTITKELDGRELKEGEFTFELVGADKKVVSTAQNSADGSVTFGELAYKVPGTYNYVIREKNDKAGGVEYDSAEHTVVVVVTDNGDGTMTAKAELKSRNGEDAKDTIVFKNSYTAQPASVTLGASKAYVGGELKDGQFTFELKDKDGKVVSKAKNTKEGQIVFETISYDQAGTYEYKISEVNDEQKDVTYDKTVYGVTVTVTDNQEGSLMAAVEYDGGKAPVFTNKYSKPAKPAKPEEPKGPTAVKTGDEAPVIPFIILMVATLAIIVTITFIFFRRKRR